MKNFFRLAERLLMGSALIVLMIAPKVCAQDRTHVDPSQRFVDALRGAQPGQFDTALEFLERAGTDPAVSDQFKKRIGYEQGMTLYHQAMTIGDREIHERTLEEARQKLDAFAKANPDSDWGAKARELLAQFLLKKGRALTEKADKLAPGEKKKADQLRVDARKMFSDAAQTFKASEKFFAERLKKMPAIATAAEAEPASRARSRRASRRRKLKTAQQEQARLAAERQRLRLEWLFARRQLGEAMYEEALTWPAKSEERKKRLTATIEHLNKLYEKNDRSIVGLSAHLQEGRAYQALGDLKKALSCYEDLTLQPAEIPVLRKLISEAVQHQAECLRSQKKSEKYDEAIAKCSAWLRDARGAEANAPEWLAVRYQLAMAHRSKALLAAKENDNDGKKTHNRAARNEARIVARKPSPWRDRASKLLMALGHGEEEKEPTTFETAYNAGREAVQLMNSDTRVLPLARANNPKEVPAIEKRIDENRDAAFRYLQLALDLSDAKSDPEKVNSARYYLAYLNFQNARWYDAAVLGDFAARGDRNSGTARSGAQLALLAFERLYFLAPADDRAFEMRHLESVANHIIKQWPKEKEATDAYRVLVDLAIKRDDLASARDLLGKIEPSRQGGVLLQIGLAEWNQYVRAVAKAGAAGLPEGQLADEQLQLKANAKASLEKGIELIRKEGSSAISPTVAVAALNLAKLYADESDYARAIGLLEDARFGPLSLVKSNHSAAKDRYAEDTYRTALRAYVSVQPPEREKALEVMDSMEKRLGSRDEASAARITKIYISLGVKLKKHLDRLVAENRGEEAGRVKAAFVDFLDRARDRDSGNSWASRNWVAQMYFRLGKPETSATPLDKLSREYCEKAEAEYREIIQSAADQAGFAPSANAVLGVKTRLAECLATQSKFDEALAMYGEVLAEKPNSLQTQQAAAMAFQLRGDLEDAKWYQAAQAGGLKDAKTGKNKVWGWNKLSRLAFRFAQKNPSYFDAYYDARYNLTLCSFKLAMKRKGESRAKDLSRIQNSLEKFDLISNGEAWDKHRPEFEKMLKDVQNVRKKKPVGFRKK